MLFRKFILVVLTVSVNSFAFAENTSDEIDELNADSDAATADNAEVKARMAKEKAKAEARLRAASQKNQAANAKRQASADQLKKNDEEVAALTAEQTRMKSEVDRLAKETALSEKNATDSRTQIEKLKADIAALKQLRDEKAKSFIELSTQTDKVVAEMKKMELEKSQLELDLAKSKTDEKAASDKLAKVKAEEAAKKVKLDAYIAGLRERFHQAQDRISAMEAEGNSVKTANAKIEATAKVAENEVIAAEAQLTRGPVASTREPASVTAYVFKRDCKVFDQPAKGAAVLVTQKAGAKVTKSDEGRTWIAFSLEDGRKAYAAKNCF